MKVAGCSVLVLVSLMAVYYAAGNLYLSGTDLESIFATLRLVPKRTEFEKVFGFRVPIGLRLEHEDNSRAWSNSDYAYHGAFSGDRPSFLALVQTLGLEPWSPGKEWLIFLGHPRLDDWWKAPGYEFEPGVPDKYAVRRVDSAKGCCTVTIAMFRDGLVYLSRDLRYREEYRAAPAAKRRSTGSGHEDVNSTDTEPRPPAEPSSAGASEGR